MSTGSLTLLLTILRGQEWHEDVIKKITAAALKKIVYISCNPSTQARDILLISDYYQVAVVQPVDMFPHTHHVENVVLLKKESRS